MKRIIKFLIRKLGYEIRKVEKYYYISLDHDFPPQRIKPSEFAKNILSSMADYRDRMRLLEFYDVEKSSGDVVLRRALSDQDKSEAASIYTKNGLQNVRYSVGHNQDPKLGQNKKFPLKIHYGCGPNLLDGWVNVDLYERQFKHVVNKASYMQMNIIEKHGFPPNTFNYGYSEDVLEHLSQADSLVFISECFRTLKKRGVLRLSFPGLEGVLKQHYRETNFASVINANLEAFTLWDHVHFYSREEIEMVARHLGFSSVKFVPYGESEHIELRNIETRSAQIDLNTIAELKK